ncbi:uncharacterized protein MYCGRDRAFT_66160 [Zymoseptoria tritici IPO323]|uniref:Uncharacterized protein n=1 Tax=Zymoseptoria tritici (strain CBS 115943 / IPO323) TaxID=336722 RepID=F9X045_ZYMTI|nr:uncharacterized protein MYCGRDRAFT_66160 [Zymoseptoria tritici IPO323]EGP92336.1 hypothetical protein MYCGRDRAFT_66160 [Zymoseptoria tritici IPO323]
MDSATVSCDTGNAYDGRIGLRVSALFVILVGSTLGAVFPVFAARHPGVGVPEWAFFVAKYFGSGVIVATAFIHLLAPANEALTNPCLTGAITDYTWVEGIALMTIFVLFFVEIMAMRFATFGQNDHPHDINIEENSAEHVPKELEYQDEASTSKEGGAPAKQHRGSFAPGNDHLGHTRDHVDAGDNDKTAEVAELGVKKFDADSYAARMTALMILEFGIIFHSVFIGLTLAVAGEEFNTLYVVLVFHQTFEGLALGSRLGSMEWPRSKRWTPYLMGVGYGLSTPIAIAIGLGVRTTFKPESQTTLIVNGVFDSLSAGILIYTGLVEVMAHEFIFSTHMNQAPVKVVLQAFGWMTLGAALMALLGKWA